MEKIAVTIGITAYNEEKNITNLLKSIFAQKQVGYTLNKIIVIIDGSTDATAEKIKKFKKNNIVIVDDKKRLGPSQRVNQLFRMLTDDVLVYLDADIVLKDELTISKLIKPLRNPKVGLVSGRLLQKNKSSFLEKSINASIQVYENYIDAINSGSNIYGIKGAILAMSAAFCKTVRLPKNVYANDAYLYFDCISKGFLFTLVKNANAWYQVPATIKDHVSQNTRYVSSPQNLTKYFGELVLKEYSQKKLILLKYMMLAVLTDPTHTLFIFILNQYSRRKSVAFLKSSNTKWESISSTK